MAEVSKQCERVREQATDKLEDCGGEDEAEGSGQPRALRCVRVVVGCGRCHITSVWRYALIRLDTLYRREHVSIMRS